MEASSVMYERLERLVRPASFLELSSEYIFRLSVPSLPWVADEVPLEVEVEEKTRAK